MAEIDRATYVYGRGDYGTEYAHNLIEKIEQWNCSRGACVHSGTEADRAESGPGGTCHLLASVFFGQPVPEFDPQRERIVCESFDGLTDLGDVLVVWT